MVQLASYGPLSLNRPTCPVALLLTPKNVPPSSPHSRLVVNLQLVAQGEFAQTPSVVLVREISLLLISFPGPTKRQPLVNVSGE